MVFKCQILQMAQILQERSKAQISNDNLFLILGQNSDNDGICVSMFKLTCLYLWFHNS